MDRGLLDNLKEILQERISFSESVRNNHAKGEDAYDPIPVSYTHLTLPTKRIV